jgi:hypothetical protein
MDVGYVLHRARSIAWQHKALWAFGFLVGLGTAGTRAGMARIPWDLAVEELPPEVQGPILDLVASPYLASALVLLALLGLAAGAGLMVLNTLGRIGLVHQTRAAEEYGVVVLKGGWLAGKRHLSTVLIIRLLLGVPMAVIILAGATPAFVTWLLTVGQDPELAVLGILGSEIFRLTCSAPAWCTAAVLSIPIGLVQRLAVRACVLEHLDARGSFARAWEMIREHTGGVALVWAILLGLGTCVLLLIGLPLAVVWLLFLTTARMTVIFSSLLSIGLTLLLGLVTWLVATLIVGVTEAFSSVTWTLAYREMTGMGRTGEETDPRPVVASTQG